MKICTGKDLSSLAIALHATGSLRFNETNYELMSFPNSYGLPMNL